MYSFTPADFADTGQWRMIIHIHADGLQAYLENTIHPEAGLQLFCAQSWDSDPAHLKKNIEDTVYSNPRLLDDFATTIILYTQDVLFIPTRIAEADLDSEANIYNKFYSAEPLDVMSGQVEDITAVWSMGPGIKSFLLRTFPGSRITCNLLEMVKQQLPFSEKTNVCLNTREKETDLVVTSNQKLITASTHSFTDKEKTSFLVKNALDLYGLESVDINYGSR